MKYLVFLFNLFFLICTLSAQKSEIGFGINYNDGQFVPTNRRLFLYDSGYNVASTKSSMGLSFNIKKRLSADIVFESYANLLLKTPSLSKAKYEQPEGGIVREYLQFRFFSVELGSKVFFSRASWKLKLYPFAGLNISINHYTGLTSGKHVRNGSLSSVYYPDFTEHYPTTVSLGGIIGASYPCKLFKRKADVYTMANFALTNPFYESIGTDSDNRSMYLDGRLTLYSLGVNVFFKQDKKKNKKK